MKPRFAAAISEHPLATQAVGETVGSILEQLDDPPDLVVMFATDAHTGVLEDMTRAVRTLLNPRVLVGSNAESVLGGSQEVEHGPALCLFAARFDVDLQPIRLEAFPGPDGAVIVAGGTGLESNEGTLLLLADPATFPVTEVVEHLGEVVGAIAVAGGMSAAGHRPGGNRLILDDERFADGAVGVLLPPTVGVTTLVSQGCRPFGSPMVVTKAEGNVIYELAGRPALDRLMEQVGGLDTETRAIAAKGLHVGLVIDEGREHFGAGDFLVRGVLGADKGNGAVAIGEPTEVGATVQFHLRDPARADEDLRLMLAAQQARGVLAFTCNGRGRRFFGTPNHDAELLGELLDAPALAGMFCAGELGPVGGRTFLHSFTTSLALFG